MKKNQPTIFEASFVLSLIIFSISFGVIGLKISPQIAILFAIAEVMSYAIIKKMPVERLNKGFVNGVTPGIIPIFIFLLVGALIAIWIQSGIIPTLMVYGFYPLVYSFRFFSLCHCW